MLGRCQHALYRGVLAGLQQHQQRCLQLEVLGLQTARTFFNDYKISKRPSRKIRDIQRKHGAVERVLGKTQQAASASSSSSLLPGLAAASVAEHTPAAAAVDDAPAAAEQPAAAAAASGGPSASPLQAVPVISGSTHMQPKPAAAGDEQKRSWAPSWLSDILDMPRRRRTPPAPKAPAKSSPLQDTAPQAEDTKGQAKEADGWESLNDTRDMTLDYYHKSIRQEEMGRGADTTASSAPRPHKPPLLGPRSNYSSRLDKQRVFYHRHEQQSNLIVMMSEADKERIQQHGKAVLKDKETMSRIARTAGVDELVVADVINRYCYLKEYYSLLREYRDAGNKMPHVDDNVAVAELQDRLKQEKQQEELKAVLKYRDPENCQLRAWSHVTGPNRKCSRTNLPYKLCCGDLRGRNWKADSKGRNRKNKIARS